ncbi:hypothetical protein ABT160_41395 [Streptomyces sp. NPDC001941]|uniref:hypothetical protein n=1 Tax=Streptomyces sp. NPDC001941 TaxID=3154659 RepID=UPI003332E6FC
MDIRTELDNFLGEKRTLVDAITREFRAGTSANEVARQAAQAFGRDQVKQYLAAVALHDTARKALSANDLQLVDVYVTGIEAPRETRLILAADPVETDSYASLPRRIRLALRDYHLTLDLPHATHGENTDARIDALLLEGQAVRVVRLNPRT